MVAIHVAIPSVGNPVTIAVAIPSIRAAIVIDIVVLVVRLAISVDVVVAIIRFAVIVLVMVPPVVMTIIILGHGSDKGTRRGDEQDGNHRARAKGSGCAHSQQAGNSGSPEKTPAA